MSVNQLIPNTENETVAKIALAFEFVLRSGGNHQQTLDEMLQSFDSAYKAISETISPKGESPTRKGRVTESFALGD